MTALQEVAPRERAGVRREALYFAVRNGKLMFGFGLVLVFLLLGLVGPVLTGGTPNEYGPQPMSPPSAGHWFGTTTFGQDIFLQF